MTMLFAKSKEMNQMGTAANSCAAETFACAERTANANINRAMDTVIFAVSIFLIICLGICRLAEVGLMIVLLVLAALLRVALMQSFMRRANPMY